MNRKDEKKFQGGGDANWVSLPFDVEHFEPKYKFPDARIPIGYVDTKISDEIFISREIYINGISLEEFNESSTYFKLRSEEYKQVIKDYEKLNSKDFQKLDEMKVSRKRIEKGVLQIKTGNKLLFLSSMIPRNSREEAIADIQEIVSEMKGIKCHRFYIGFIVILNVASVLYHAFFFKLTGYFYPKKQSTNED